VGDSQMLQGKRAVIFGAGGSIGAAVASEFGLKARRSFWLGEPSRTSKISCETSFEFRCENHLARFALLLLGSLWARRELQYGSQNAANKCGVHRLTAHKEHTNDEAQEYDLPLVQQRCA
jgi:NAD(P)-dependent dehydrogenase (short-subunit alcohol dehydrogenase family)